MRRARALSLLSASVVIAACHAGATHGAAAPVGVPAIRVGEPTVWASQITLCPAAQDADSLPSYAPEEVTRPAARIRGVAPNYPAELRETNTSGSALIAFVINRVGCSEMGSRNELRATHAAFAEATWEAIRRTRFRPAERDGVPVRQRSTMPYTFVIGRY